MNQAQIAAELEKDWKVADHNDRALPVHEIEGFADLLSEPAKKIYNTEYGNTVIDYDRCGERKFAVVQSFCVVEKLKDVPGACIPPECVDKMAFVFDMLVSANAIDHGIMLKASWMELARSSEEAGRRVALMMWVYPSEHIAAEEDPTKALNEAVGEKVFAPEGDMATGLLERLPTRDDAGPRYDREIALDGPTNEIDHLATKAKLVEGVAQWIASIVAREYERSGIARKRIGLDEKTFMAFFEDVIWCKTQMATSSNQYPIRPKVEIVGADGMVSLIQIETLPGFDGSCCKTLVYPLRPATLKPKRPWWSFWFWRKE